MINFTQMIYRKYFRNRNCWSEVKIKSAPFFPRGDSDMSAVHQRRRRRYQHASEAFHQRQRSRPSFKRCKTFFGMCGGGGLYVCNLAEKTDTVPSPRCVEKGFAKFLRYTHCKKVRLHAYGTRGGYAGCRNKLLCNVSLLEYSTADIS